MARLFAGIDTERDTQVTRIGHRKLATFIQTNFQRVTIDATPEKFTISIGRGRYENAAGASGVIAEVKDGYIFIPAELQDRIIFKSGV